MRTTVAVIIAALMLWSGSALAAPSIAVVDLRAAVFGSDAAKKQLETLRADQAGEEAEWVALRNAIQSMREKHQKDEVTMSADEARKSRQAIEDKLAEYNFMGERLQKRTQEAHQNVLKNMLPVVEKALLKLKDEKKYEVIMHKEAVLWATDEYDITAALIKKINETNK